MPELETAAARPGRRAEPEDVVFITSGNLNGRVVRLVADHVHRTSGLRVTLLTFGTLTTWPEERTSPHLVELLRVDRDEAKRRIASARVFVCAASFYNDMPELFRFARRVGTPTVCLVADIGFGTERFDPADSSSWPDRICVADPVTKALLLQRKVPASILKEAGSPYLDTVLQHAPLSPLDSPARRVGFLVNPELEAGPVARSTDRAELDVVREIQQVIASLPDSVLTLRLHPRLDSPTRIDLPSAIIDPTEPQSSFPVFVSGHHRIIGTHSTGLLVARMLGRPALSFQPSRHRPVDRGEVFAAWGVPVVREAADVRAWLLDPIEETIRPFPIEAHLYQPGRSVETIAELIGELSCAARR